MNHVELKRAREALGLTPEEAAALLEVGNRRAVYRIEAGERPPPVRYAALLRALIERDEARKGRR